ncbi:hypothetical protein EDD17DRAFT_1504863 [Pisolithus thermaeus]|nr:hypothetical protein EDD17DRAFT_1504863 [Pisolithus thermaeus]
MSQPLSLIPTPLATAVQHWLVVPDSAIQSDKQKVAKEAATQERVEAECQEREAVELHRQEEAEHQEREENECQEKEENECWEREANKAKVDCTYELAKATSTKKVQKCIVPAESMSPRASEKKKHAWAKSLEVEVVGGSLQAEKGKSVACDTSITGGLYAIAAVIDWHTEEMAQLQQMVKTLGSLHHHVIESMVELLQEMTYPELELPTESGSEESEEAKALDEPGWK